MSVNVLSCCGGARGGARNGHRCDLCGGGGGGGTRGLRSLLREVLEAGLDALAFGLLVGALLVLGEVLVAEEVGVAVEEAHATPEPHTDGGRQIRRRAHHY